MLYAALWVRVLLLFGSSFFSISRTKDFEDLFSYLVSLLAKSVSPHIIKLPITHYTFVHITLLLCLTLIIQHAVMHFIISFIMPFYGSFIEFFIFFFFLTTCLLLLSSLLIRKGKHFLTLIPHWVSEHSLCCFA